MRLKVALPNECNDPFEFTPITKLTTSNDWLRQLENDPESFRELHQMYLNEGRWTPSWPEFLRGLPNAIKHYSSQTRKRLRPLFRENDLKWVDTASRQVGALCLSASADSIPMWAHYGDDQKGVVIAVKGDDHAFSSGILKKVRYLKHRVRVDMRKEKETEALRMAFTKSKEWAYEREFRILFHVTDLVRGKLKDGRTGHFVDVWDSTIESVILGCSIHPDDEASIRQILKSKRRFANVKLLRAHRHPKRFSLTIAPVTSC
jgi:hypothetical protein